MLVLTRATGQKVVIGNEVVVEILSVSGDGVRLGISAPRETSVHRFEIFEQIQIANNTARTTSETLSNPGVSTFAAQLRARETSNDEKGTTDKTADEK